MLKFHDNRNQNIARRIADMTLVNYNKGLQIKEQEESPDTEIDDEVTVINPTSSKKRSYSVKKKEITNKAKLSKNTDVVKGFIQDSNILDNELNAMITLFKLPNKDKFYGGAIGNIPDDASYERKYASVLNEIKQISKAMSAKDLKEYIAVRYEITVTKGKFMDFVKSRFPLDSEASDEDKDIFIIMMTVFMNNLLTVKNGGELTEEQDIAEFGPAPTNIEDESVDEPVEEDIEVDELNDSSEDESDDDSEDDESEDDESEDDESDDDEEEPKDAEPRTTKELQEYLKAHNIPVIKHRSNAPGDQGRLIPTTRKDIIDSYLQTSQNKSKNGIIVDNDIDMKKFSADLVLQTKKIHLLVTNLLPIAQNLLENRYGGATYNDISKIKALYEDMDHKMYILTSMNHESMQLIKLDNDFETLYNRVKGGTHNHNPMTGGSMHAKSLGLLVHPMKHNVNTDILHIL